MSSCQIIMCRLNETFRHKIRSPVWVWSWQLSPKQLTACQASTIDKWTDIVKPESILFFLYGHRQLLYKLTADKKRCNNVSSAWHTLECLLSPGKNKLMTPRKIHYGTTSAQLVQRSHGSFDVLSYANCFRTALVHKEREREKKR